MKRMCLWVAFVCLYFVSAGSFLPVHAQEEAVEPAPAVITDTQTSGDEQSIATEEVPQDVEQLLEEQSEALGSDVGVVISDVQPVPEETSGGMAETVRDPALERVESEVQVQNDVRMEAVKEMEVVTLLNEELPFILTGTTTFAINTVPEFFFVHTKKGIVEESLTAVGAAVLEVYEGSVLETVIETVIEVTERVVDFVIPNAAEAQEELVEGVSEPEVQVVPVLVEQSEVSSETAPPSDVEASDVRMEDPVADMAYTLSSTSDMSTQAEAAATAVLTATATPQTPEPPYAVVDGRVVLAVVQKYDEESFAVRLEGQAFDVGTHALSLHLVFEDVLYVFNTTFTVSGTRVVSLPLQGTLFASIISDHEQRAYIWLEDYASGTLKSFEMIQEVDPTLLPTLSFDMGTLLWLHADGSALYGYDLAAKTLFSQSVNEGGRASNTLELETGIFNFHTNNGSVSALTVKPSEKP